MEVENIKEEQRHEGGGAKIKVEIGGSFIETLSTNG